MSCVWVGRLGVSHRYRWGQAASSEDGWEGGKWVAGATGLGVNHGGDEPQGGREGGKP